MRWPWPRRRFVAETTPAERKSESLNAILRWLKSGSETTAGYDVSESSALAVQTVLACVQLIANDVATLPLKVRRAGGSEMQDAPEVPEWRLLLRRPNEWQTAFEFRQMMTAQALLRGDAYAFKVMAGDDRVKELWPLRRGEVTVERRGFELAYHVNAYEGSISGRFGRERILHLRGFTWDGATGLDRMHLMRDAIGVSGAAQGAQGRSFKNGVRMPGYWSTEQGLSDEALDNLAAALAAQTSGDAQWRSPILDSGLTWKATAQNFDEAQLIETRRHQMIEICSGFGVVPAVLGIDDKTQAFASVEAMMRWHLQHTLRPWLMAWEQALDRDVLDDAGPLFARFDTADMEKASTRERAESYRDLLETLVLMPNEARALEGLPRIAGLDEDWREIRRGQAGINGPADEGGPA